MSNVDYKKRALVLSFICALVIIALAMTIISLIQSLKDDSDFNPVEKHLYATVLESGNNYVKVSDLEKNESYMFMTKNKYDEGDLVSISYIQNNDDVTTKNIEIVAKKNEIEDLNNTSDNEIPTTSVSTSNGATTTSKSSSKTTSTTSQKVVSNESDVVSFFKEEYENYGNYEKEKSIPEKAKKGFVTIVDFLFYDGTIKGKKFSELTNAAKAKVIYYALLIDSKIDNKWPDYKNTIKNKATDLKAKLIAKYMEVTTSICDKNTHACDVARDDFKILKKSLNLTWNVIKDAAKYSYGKITTYISAWYETWRDN